MHIIANKHTPTCNYVNKYACWNWYSGKEREHNPDSKKKLRICVSAIICKQNVFTDSVAKPVL